MNLPYTYALLRAASEQNGLLKLTGQEAARELEQMAAIGLVEAAFDDGQPGSFDAIVRVLPAGYTFLRALKGKLPSRTARPVTATRRVARS